MLNFSACGAKPVSLGPLGGPVAWSWESIHKEWLLGESIGAAPTEIVAAFDAAERMLGNDWINQHRITSTGLVAGASPTLAVVSTGRALAVIEGRPGADRVVDRLKSADRAAFAELKAIYLCCAGMSVKIEMEPDLRVDVRNRKPDFRVRESDAPWTYVEVAAPDISETREQAELVMQEIASILPELAIDTAVDLFLRREPTLAEIDSAKREMLRLGKSGTAGDYDIGYGIISVNMSHPSRVEPRDFGVEPYTPRLGLARAEGVAGTPANKRVSVRYPYSDERAEEFLTREAKQLSRESPGLVMLSLSSTVAPFRTWRPLLARRLQPNLHRRVSAVCLFVSGMESTLAGEDVVSHTSVVENPYSLHQLPAWLSAALRRFEAA